LVQFLRGNKGEGKGEKSRLIQFLPPFNIGNLKGSEILQVPFLLSFNIEGFGEE